VRAYLMRMDIDNMRDQQMAAHPERRANAKVRPVHI
jgi:hypothetical protein